jgi:hypothetical protein
MKCIKINMVYLPMHPFLNVSGFVSPFPPCYLPMKLGSQVCTTMPRILLEMGTHCEPRLASNRHPPGTRLTPCYCSLTPASVLYFSCTLLVHRIVCVWFLHFGFCKGELCIFNITSFIHLKVCSVYVYIFIYLNQKGKKKTKKSLQSLWT